MQTSNRSRPRLSRACARCAQRKLGCDKIRPRCGRCTRDEVTCEYATNFQSGSQPLTFIVQEGSTLQSSSGDTSNVRDDAVLSEQDAGHLFLGAQSKSQYLSPTFFATIREELSEIEALVRSQRRRTRKGPSDPFAKEIAGWISTGSEYDRFYGDIFPPAAKELASPTNEGGNGYDFTLKQIVIEMPSQEQQDVLVWAYIRGSHTVNPLFNSMAFMQQVKDFQAKVGTDSYVPNAHFLALLNAVLFTGAVVSDRSRLVDAFPHISRNSLVMELYHLAIRAMRISGFPHSPSIQSFAAFLITNTVLLRDEDPLACCAFVGTAFRVAQMLGLHRDPSKFSTLSSTDAQVRRQIWFSLITADAQVAFASGLPPLIESSLYSVDPISEKSDLSFMAGSDLPTSDHSILGIFVAGKINFYRRASLFLHGLHSNVISSQELHEIMEITDSIQHDLEKRIEHIAQLSALASPTHGIAGTDDDNLRQAEMDPNLAQFASVVLSMLAAKPYAIMYGPLRKHRLLGDAGDLRSRVFMYCRKYLLLFLLLTQRKCFQPWHWCWPGQHQPFHSIMALITHLDESPHEATARETRKLIDLAFLLCRDDTYGGIVANDEGEESTRSLTNSLNDDHRGPWRLVRLARDRVWEKAGLDSNVLVCPPRVDEIRFDDIDMPQIPEVEVDGTIMGESEMQYFLHSANSDWDFLGQLPDPAVTLAAPDGLL